MSKAFTEQVGWKKGGVSLVDYTGRVFSVFFDSVSPSSIPTGAPSLMCMCPCVCVCKSTEYTDNIAVTYAWAPGVLSGESSSLSGCGSCTSHHPVCSVCSTARFVFWVKAGAAVALKNNGNKRGKPARVLAQGSHGHGGHVS